MRRMVRHSNSGMPLDKAWPFALADGEVCYVGEPVAMVLADDRYIAEDAAALVAVDYEPLPFVADVRTAKDSGADPPRALEQRHHHLQGRVRRRRRGVRQGRACVQAGAVAAPRRGAFDRGARAARRAAPGRRRHHGARLDAEGARSAADADLADGLRPEPARRRPRHRRRLRRQALRLFRGRRRGGGGEAARPLDQVDRGPPRIFHQRGARARPVLGAGDRGRCRGQGAGRARQAAARHRRLHAAGPEHPLQLGLDHERALHRAGAVDRSHHRHEQQDAGVVGARRRLSAGGVRDGAAARSGGARDEARPRRGAAAQSHSGEQDAVQEAAEGALRRGDGIRQRRLSGLPGRGAGRRRLGRVSETAGRGAERAAAISASASRMA